MIKMYALLGLDYSSRTKKVLNINSNLFCFEHLVFDNIGI